MTGDDHSLVHESDECGQCGVSIPSDGEGEYRHRVLLEDYVRAGGSRIAEKLCETCWQHVRQAVVKEGGR